MERNTVRIDSSGRILLPASYRKSLGLRSGDEVIVMERDGVLRILSREMAVKQAQALVRQYVPAGTRLSEELIRERRADDVN